MQSLVNPGEAKQIEQDYAHTTLASSEMVAASAQATAEAIQAFIQSLRERLRAAQESEQDPKSEAQAPQADDLIDAPPALTEPIEIKMGREIVYREGYAHKDPVNKLNANTLKLLRAAVDAPHPAGAEATTEVKGTINIKAGDDLVYRMSQGAVEKNHFAPLPESPVEAPDLAVVPESPTVAVETDPPSLIDDPPPSPSSPPPTQAAQPLAMAAPKVVSILDVMERQAPPGADPKTRQWMQHTTGMMRRSSQQLTERVVALAANIRSRQVASTAVELIQAYGTTYRPGRGFYVAENYVIKAKGRMVTVSDREGVELMTARKTRWGLDILKNDMVPSQEADFMKARQQIQIQGMEGLSPDPPLRVRQLGNLAPAGDRGITRDLTALALAKTARKLLEVTGSRPNVQGKRVFQGGSQYRIEETPNSLKIQAGERGQILSIDNGKIKTDLTSKDVAYFRFIDRELSQDLQLHAATKVTPLPRQIRPARAMGE